MIAKQTRRELFTKVADRFATSQPVEKIVGQVILYTDGYNSHLAKVQHLRDSYFIRVGENELLLPNIIDKLLPRFFAAPHQHVSGLEGFAWSYGVIDNPYVRMTVKEQAKIVDDLHQIESATSKWLGLEPRLD